MEMLDVANVTVSPLFTVLLPPVKVPNQRRIGVPAESHNSIPPMVQDGMLVKLTDPAELVIDPLDADPQIPAVDIRAYDPPDTSLPAAVAVEGVVVVINAKFTGVVGAV
jgi:hypothetical protein